MENNLPDFEVCLAQSADSLHPEELSALHGLICGLLCAKPALELKELTEIIPRMGQEVVLQSELVASLADLLECSHRQLADEDLGLQIWLPDDDTALKIRTHCLADWCSAVLAGLSELAGEMLTKIYAQPRTEDNEHLDGTEALRDFTAIARLADEPIEASEGNEEDFAEICEYARMALLLFQEMLRGPDRQDSIH